MEFGMNTNLVGTKRTYENASQQKITPKIAGSLVDGSEESTKRRKLLEDETLKNNENSVSIKIMLPNNEQKDFIPKKEDTGSKNNNDS